MTDRASKILFWGCFIALIATAFGFIGRMFLLNVWAVEFSLDPAQVGRLAGIGIWPFAVSIILFSLVIDKIGYKTSMIIAFLGHMIWAVMGISAYFVSQGGNTDLAFKLLYWGSLILALGNGTVEAFINPVVATMFNKEKTKWLNILHAGWPGGLVLAGIVTIFLGDIPWWIKVGLIAVPAVVYFIMLIKAHFPENERVAAGVSYREMLQEFGVLGAIVVAFLITLQLMDFFAIDGEVATGLKWFFIILGVAMVVAFGVYTKALGRKLLFFLILIMIPLATTEIGTDGWITGIMESVLTKVDPGWVLVYTSAIMLVLRFFAGPIVHSLSPLGLLATSAVLAIVGLIWLSSAQAVMVIFAAATLYGIGKTFFWPTMLGVVSEQSPKGGALTLNAIAGIGMLAVGTLGFPYIGVLQTQSEQRAIAANEDLAQAIPGLVVDGAVSVTEEREIYEILTYEVLSEDGVNELVSTLDADAQAAAGEQLKDVRDRSKQSALAAMAKFPAIMLVCYLILIFYFRSKGGYKAEILTGHVADDEKFTGGVEGPADK